MLRYASNLPDDYEYGIIWWGQSNATPNGTHTDGVTKDPFLSLGYPGDSFTIDIAVGSGTETMSATSTFITSMTADYWIGAELRMGSPTSVARGYGTVTDNTTTTITVTWTVNPAGVGNGQVAYVVFRDGRNREYNNVRVLQPYLPDQSGNNRSGTPAASGYTIPSTITSYNDLGLFLPFTFFEGINGGSASLSDFDGTFGTPTASTLPLPDTTQNSGFVNDVFNGGYIIVEHANGTSWGAVTDYAYAANVATFTVSAWLGNGTPSTPTAMRVWFPHWLSNPHEFQPGEGFLYPTNHSQPIGAVKNRPKGNTTVAWGTKFGAVLSWAARIADATGKRVNVINLAIDSSSILQTQTLWPTANIGWYNNTIHSDWNPATTNGLAARLGRMITTMAPAALTAEGNTKTLKIIGITGFQGETESTTAVGQAQYKNLLPTFYNWLRKTIFDAGLSYYDDVETMPIVHARIRSDPWESVDTDGVVNAAIANFAAKVPFVATIDVDDSPLIGGDVHFDGEGEAINGKLAAVALLQEIDDALSVEGDTSNADAVNICNMALAYIGDVAKITSLDTTVDLSAQATYCARFYSQARDTLLQQMAWSFATKRTPLEVITDARDAEWAYAYGYPNCAVRVFAVLPPDAGDDYFGGVHGTATVQDATTSSIRNIHYSSEIPLPFTVEQDDDGHKIIYTNTADAVGRYNTLVADASLYPPLFKNCLALKLASMLAGPIVRGTEGAKLTGALLQMLEVEMGKAEKQDTIQHNVKPDYTPKSVRARR